VGPAAGGEPAGALGLALHVQGVDLGHLDAEDLLDRLGDLDLVRVLGHLEGVLLGLGLRHGLLGDDGALDDIISGGSHYANTSSMTARAALSTINLPALTISYTLSTLAVVVTTPGMFRADSTTFWFTSGVTTTAFLAPTASRKPFMFLVLMASRFRPSTTTTSPEAALAERADLRARRFTFLLTV